MAETTLDLRHIPTDRAYARLHANTLQVLAGIDDEIAGMATISSLVHHAFRHLWTGFYRVVQPNLLRVGPYQGTLGCLQIEFGRGVCGVAAREQRSVVVPDVSHFSGHIRCDSRSRSEIVIPVFDAQGLLIAIFDIDSTKTAAFDQEDAAGLERLLTWFAGIARG